MSDPLNTPEDAIIRSWHVNAEPWAAALQSQSIQSRLLVTDQAVVDAVRGMQPRRVLDLGCGEGWLSRALSAHGMDVVGIDVVPALIARARTLGAGNFHVGSYRDIVDGLQQQGPFDAIVCNFSLFGQASVETLIGSIRSFMTPDGFFIVQTLHPVAACGPHPYRDGWRPGSWSGFSSDFSDPAPWYFRTLATWYAMLREHGLEVLECREPTGADAQLPSSVIFICGHRRAPPA
jgi:2-polyprenyl-3-methyl-5-hydroxy-6-metoxy-1,4-benzoquinol methylase